MAEATTTDTAEETSQDVKVEDVGPARKRLTITVPAEAVSEKLEDSLGTLATETSLPGFRKGRAPRKLLEKRFGTAVRNETKNQIVADAYSKAIEAEKLKPVGDPEPGEELEDLEVEAGKPITFSIEVEVAPEFELPDLKGVEIEKPVFEITDDDINAELTRQQQQFGTPVEIESDFVEGDRLGGSVVITKEGEAEPVFTHDQAVILCPSKDDGGRGAVLGLMVEGLAGIIDGTKVGDELTIKTVGPEAHEREDIRGAKLTIVFQVKQASRIDPATHEHLIELFQLGNEENLREQVKLALQHRSERDQATAMRDQLYKHLTATIDFDLPEKLTAAQAGRNLERYRFELLDRGMTPDEVEDKLAEVRGDSETQTRERLKLFFILHRLADHYDIQVSEQEINGRVASIAAQRGVRPDQLRNELIRSGNMDNLARGLREQKAADRVIGQAKVTEVSAEEWNARMIGGSDEATGKKTGSKKTTKKKTSKKTSKTSKKTSTKK